MLTETLDAPTLIEDYRGDPKNPLLGKVRGRFLREGAISKAGRVYTSIAESLAEAQGRLDADEIIDMRVRHPGPNGGPSVLETVGRVTALSSDGCYEGVIANTAAGRDVFNLLDAKCLRAVSLAGDPITESQVLDRAMRSQGVTRNIQKFHLQAIDYTNHPNIAEATAALAESDGSTLLDTFEVSDLEESMDASTRKQRVSDGDAMPGGKFPIANQAELDAAVHLIGNSTAPEAAIKAHIIKQAKKYDLKLPDSWTTESASAGATLSESESEVTAIAEAIAGAITESKGTKKASKKAWAADTAIGAAILKATGQLEEGDPGDEQPEVPEAKPETESTEEAEVKEAADAIAALSEAGRAISAPNASKLKGAHDVIASMAGMPCAPDASESSTGAGLNEAQADLVESAVKAALTEADTRWNQKFEALSESFSESVATEAQKLVTQVLKARRQSAAPDASVEESGTQTMTFKDALRAKMISRGVIPA